MGAWGAGPFDNDDALDWLAMLSASRDFTEGRQALDVAREDYLDASDGSMALAAAKVVAVALGHPAPSLPDGVTAWVNSNRFVVAPADAAIALVAVERVLAGNSELQDLWADAACDTWLESVQALRQRLIASRT
jgi:Domain of unknown function (DUF4259)